MPIHGVAEPKEVVKYKERSSLLRNLSRCRLELRGHHGKSLTERLRQVFHHAKIGLTNSILKKG